MIATKEELKTLKGIIYIIKNKVNLKRYIGQTNRTFYERYKKSWWKHHSINKHLKASINKYGHQNFVFEILLYNQNENQLNYWEEFYINYFSSNNPKYGYNQKNGGDRHISKFSKDYCLKKSKETATTKNDFLIICYNKHGDNFDYNLDGYKNLRSKIIVTHKKCGYIFTVGAYSHIAQKVKTGCKKCCQKFHKKKCRPVVQIDIKNNIILNYFGSSGEAAKYIKSGRYVIFKSCNSNLCKFGYKWEYLDNIKKYILNDNNLNDEYKSIVKINKEKIKYH